MKKIIKRLATAAQKVKKAAISVLAAATTMAIGMTNSLAATTTVPPNVNTTQTDQIANIIVWVLAIAIGAGGGLPSLVKIVEGQTNEDVRGRNSGIAGLCVTAACVGAVVAVKAIFF